MSGPPLGYRAGLARIGAGPLERLYVIWGDSYLVGKLSRALRARMFPGGAGEDLDSASVDAASAGPYDVLTALRTVPFASPRRLVVLDRMPVFRAKGREGRAPAREAGAAEDDAAETAGAQQPMTEESEAPGPGGRSPEATAWEAALSGIPDSACLLIPLEAAPDARLRLTKLAAEVGVLVDCATSGRGGADLAAGVLREEATERGLRLDWRVASLLITTCGTDCGRLVQELEKLALYCRGRAPTEQDVLLLCPRSSEVDIWQLLNAVEAGRAGEAARIVRASLARGENAAALVASMSSQVRIMARAKERSAAGVSYQALPAVLGANRFWVEQSLRRSRVFTLDALYQALCDLAGLDLGIKSGELDGDLALEAFVLGLCAVRQGPRGTGSPDAARTA